MPDVRTAFITTPESHSSKNGHWDRVEIGDLEQDVAVKYLEIRFQNGPVKEFGVNGVQLTDVLKICLARYRMLNKSFPCCENRQTIKKLVEGIMWDEERTAKRTAQGVEGYDKPRPRAS